MLGFAPLHILANDYQPLIWALYFQCSPRRFGIKFLDSAVILTIITAFLYSASTAYTHGYFGILNLDSDVLDRNFHQILYHGMILNIWTFLTVPLVVALTITTHGAFVTQMSRYVRKSFANGRKLSLLRKKLRLNIRKYNSLELIYSNRIKVGCVFFFCLIYVRNGIL